MARPAATGPRKPTPLRIVLITVAALVLLLLVWVAAGRETVPEDAVGLLDSALRADRVLAPGVHATLPGLERVRIVAPYRRDTVVEWVSPEGTRVGIELGLAIRLTPDGARELLRRAEAPSPVERLDGAVDRIVLGAIDEQPLRDALPELGRPLETALAETLGRFGRLEKGPSLAFSMESPVVQALLQDRAARKVREMARETGVRILVVGLDGADWQIAEPLIERGRLPHLAALRRDGAWGNIKALTPVLSPLIWTSVATGVTADRHGILDFLVRDPRSGEKVPVNSRYRKVRALWNIFSDAGRSADFVAWWATWPAEEVDGHLISDRVSYSLFDFDLPTEGIGATYPPGYLSEIRPRLIGDDEITYEEVARFADVTREEFTAERALIEEERKAAYKRPLNHLTKILASTRNYHTIALDLLKRGPADLTAVYYQGIDEVGHRFMHYAPPRMDGVTAEDVRRYGRVVDEFYVYQDELLGELLRAAGPETTVIVLSDHGFLNGPDRPRGQTADIEGKPARWHRRYGVLALAGPPIAPTRLDTTSMLDITPTVLRLAGLPVAEDMEGRVIEEAIRPAFRERFPIARIDTYESVPLRMDAAPLSDEMAAIDAEVMDNLRALGYIGGGGGTPEPAPPVEPAGAAIGDPEGGYLEAGTVTGHANLAGVLLANGDLEEAEAEILAALELAPRFATARRLLFDLRARQDRLNEALEIALRMIDEGEVEDARFLARVAEVYREAGRSAEGIRRFRRGVLAGRWELGVPLARLLLLEGEAGAADRAARAVLDRDPLNEAATATLFRAAQAERNLDRVEPLLQAALQVNPRSVMHLNWLAVVFESRGEMPRAEQLLRRALEADPDNGPAMANLGAFYGRHGRAAEAVPLLQRALRISPGNEEARVNLGTALARLGRMNEAIAEFERAVRDGCREVGVYNALARAYGERGDLETAADWLRRSLEIDPQQEQIRRLLASVEAR